MSIFAVPTEDPELTKAKTRMERIVKDAKAVIAILTAEQALKAQKVVREAGR